MAHSISASVGAWEKGAKNQEADVQTVQKMLEAVSRKENDPAVDPHGVDGVIGRPSTKSNTVKAIRAFQSRFLSVPDGLISVGGRTWTRLLALIDEHLTVGVEFFPFSKLPSASWTDGIRRFATNRSNGTRAHAGCDLYSPAGTVIHAIADGEVICNPYPFYDGTWALEVRHGSRVVRYGEIQQSTFVRLGAKVKAGQKIARVGHLQTIKVPSDMLHLEIYDGSLSGPLTVKKAFDSKKRSDGVPFMRRKDLIDPTPLLNVWKSKLPPA